MDTEINEQIKLMYFLYHRFVFKWQRVFELSELPYKPNLTLIDRWVKIKNGKLEIKSGKALIEWKNYDEDVTAHNWAVLGLKNR